MNDKTRQDNGIEQKSAAAKEPDHKVPGAASAERAARKSQRKVSRPAKADLSGGRKRTNPLVWLGLVLNASLCVGLVGAGYYGWLQWQSLESEKVAQQTQFQTRLQKELQSQVQRQASQSAQQLSQLNRAMETQQGRISARFSELDSAIDSLASNTPQTQRRSEIQYLLRMATRKAMLEENPSAAIAILEEADGLAASDLTLSALRVRIAADVQALSVVQKVSAEEQAIKLSGLLTLSEQLAFVSAKTHFADEPQALSQDPRQWWTNLKRLWSNLVDDFLTVEKLQEPLQPLLSYEQQNLVKAKLQYHLLAARHALLHKHKALYDDAMAQAQALLPRFDANSADYVIFSQGLQDSLAQPFPSGLTIQLQSPGFFESMAIGAAAALVAPQTMEQSR